MLFLQNLTDLIDNGSMGTDKFNHPASSTRRVSFGTVLAICASGLLVASCAPKFNHQGSTSDDTASCDVESPGTSLSCPTGVSVDVEGATAANNAVIAGTGNNQLHVLCDPSGVTDTGLCSHTDLSTKTIRPSTFGGAVAGTTGDLYTLAGSGYPVNSGDGGSALSAGFYQPSQAVVDGSGNVVIDAPTHHTIRVLCMGTAGICSGQVDSNGILYASAGATCATSSSNTPSCASATAGDVYHLAGIQSTGASTNLSFGYGEAPCTDGVCTGNGGVGDGVPAFKSALNLPQAIAIDGSNNIIIADTNNNRVRVVCMTAASGVCTTTELNVGSVTAGNIYSLAGNGNPNSAGDGLLSGSNGSQIAHPDAVAVESSTNNVAVADNTNYRVRLVCGSTASGLCSGTPVNAGNLKSAGGSGATPGDIYTIAGGNGSGTEAGGNAAILNSVKSVTGLGFDGNSNLIISDSGNALVSVICASASEASGVCSKISGAGSIVATGGSATSVAYDLYTFSAAGSNNDGYIQGGSASYSAGNLGQGFVFPANSVAYTLSGNPGMIVGDRDNNVVRFMFY